MSETESNSLTPVAWRYTLLMELKQTEVRLTQDRTDTPFGRRGTDYDPSYTFTEEPLFLARPARNPA
jgi:hypothetical protein